MSDVYESELVKQMFSGTVDDCERLVAAMQYCAFIPTINTFSNAVVVTLLEKGVLYRGMLDLAELSLLDQCFYIHNKFTEFHERLMVIDVEIKITKSNLEDLLFATLSRVKSNFLTKRERMPSLKIFQIAKIGPIVLIFDNKDVSDFDECKVIIVNDSVTIIDLSWHNITHLVHELINVHFQALQHSHAYLSASMICLVRDKEVEEEEEDPNADLYDDQVLDFHEFVHMCKKEEAAGSIIELRDSIKELYRVLQLHHGQVVHDPLDMSHDDIPPPPPSSAYPPSLESTQNLPERSANVLRNNQQSPQVRMSVASITPPPQVPFPLRSPSASFAMLLNSTASGSEILASPAQFPPASPLVTSLTHDSRPASSTSSARKPADKDYSRRFDDDGTTSAAAAVLLPKPPSPPVGNTTAAHDEWTEESQFSTVFHHELWRKRNPIAFDDNVMSSQDITGGEDDHVQCNQSLSEFSVSMTMPPKSGIDVQAVNASYRDGTKSSLLSEVQTSIARMQDILREDNVDALASSLQQDTAARREGLFARSSVSASLQTGSSERPTDTARTLDEIIRDTAGDADMIQAPSSGNNVAPTHSLSPVKLSHSVSLPQQSALSPSLLPNKPANSPAISESLRQDLLASEANEDFFGYAQRAYMAMRDRAVENTDYNLSMTMSTTQPFSRPGTAVSSSLYNAPHVSDAGLSKAMSPIGGSQDPVFSSTPASALAKEMATPKSLQSVRSANHDNFDDFFAGIEESVPTVERHSPRLESKDEEDDTDMGDYEVIHPAGRSHLADSEVPMNHQPSTVVALDDLFGDLSVHTPAGRSSISVEPALSTSKKQSQSPKLHEILSENRPMSQSQQSQRSYTGDRGGHDVSPAPLLQIEPVHTFVDPISPTTTPSPYLHAILSENRPMSQSQQRYVGDRGVHDAPSPPLQTESVHALVNSIPSIATSSPKLHVSLSEHRPMSQSQQSYAGDRGSHDVPPSALQTESVHTFVDPIPSTTTPSPYLQAILSENRPTSQSQQSYAGDRGGHDAPPAPAPLQTESVHALVDPIPSASTLQSVTTAELNSEQSYVSAEPVVSYSSRRSTGARHKSSNVDDTTVHTHRNSNSSSITTAADTRTERASQRSHRETPPASAMEATTAINSSIQQRPTTSNVIFLQSLLENMKTERAALEHHQLQQAQKRNCQRIQIGREVLRMLQQQAVTEQRRQQEIDDANAWDRKRWPPSEANRSTSPARKSPTKPAEFDSVASALGRRPVPSNVPPPISRPNDPERKQQSRKVVADVEEILVVPLPSQGRPIPGGDKRVPEKERASVVQPTPSPNQQVVRIQTHPPVHDQRRSSSSSSSSPTETGNVHNKPIAWQVDLGGDGSGQPNSAIQRPRSRPRSWSVNRAAHPTNVATPSAHPEPSSSISSHVADEDRSGVDDIRSPTARQVLPSDHRAPTSPTSSSSHPLHAPSNQPVPRPRSQSAQRSRMGPGAAAASAGNTSKLSNFVQSKNAISYVCLAGGHQEEKRLEVLDLLEFYAQGKLSSTLPLLHGNEFLVLEDLRGKISQFVIMFYKAKTLAFKGIYVLDPKSRILVRVYGKGPHRINSEGEVSDLAKEFLKFETSSKSFKALPVKSLTSTVDAIILEPPKPRNIPV